MSGGMQKFVTLPQAAPRKRLAGERRKDFREIADGFEASDAAGQASRCSQCGIPFCQTHCPLTNAIPDWLKLTAEGRMEEAYALSASTNSFPEICGRICPQDRLCEGNCVIEKGFSAVTIGAVETFLTETAFSQGWVKSPRPVRELGRSVAIVGSGPAGLAAAGRLRRLGYRLEVYERQDRAGGLLIYGIPNFKLDKSIVARRVALLEEAGVGFHLNCEIGRDLPFAELRRRHDAVLLATGVYQPRTLSLEGAERSLAALDYLIAANRIGLGDTVPEFRVGGLDAKGKRVVVIGGGDTAMDCVRTAVRQEAASVTCLYRRDRASMPGSRREVAHAEEEGVRFEWQAAPVGFKGTKRRLTSVVAQRTQLGIADASGRAAPAAMVGDAFDVAADLVISALGFDPEDLPARLDDGLGLTRERTLAIDPKRFTTSLEGVFAAGDIVRGASLVVWAIRDGQDAAQSIHRWISERNESALGVAAE
ncbi:MAG TPA: NAD(P)-dependent oxidoreductase [Alphaproteobacteria bacterium]|nr:NAD(P)-dependent oxidoreductase [Alphaproteobacteria bacterium]